MDRMARMLKLLADGSFHSGEELGELLGVSRTAVWKKLKALSQYGIELQAVKGKGYRLPFAVELLERDAILAAIDLDKPGVFDNLEILFSIDSTNEYLLSKLASGLPSPYAVLAEHQSHGRGRRGRQWISPFASNLYLSLYWRFDLPAMALSGLSLAVGIAVLRAIQSLGIEGVQLKWPNDVIHDNAKLAGILLEMSGEVDGSSHVIIGVGLNVMMPEQNGEAIDQAWTKLQQLSHQSISRNRLAAALLQQLTQVLDQYQAQGLAPFIDEWFQHDCYLNQPIQLLMANRSLSGIYRGIDKNGALLLENEQGLSHHHGGEISVRADR